MFFHRAHTDKIKSQSYLSNWQYSKPIIKKRNDKQTPKREDREEEKRLFNCLAGNPSISSVRVYDMSNTDALLKKEAGPAPDKKFGKSHRLPSLYAIQEVNSRRHADYTPVGNTIKERDYKSYFSREKSPEKSSPEKQD